MAGIIIPIVCFAIIAYVVGTISWSIWRQRKSRAAGWPPYPLINASDDEMDSRATELRDRLSRKQLGTERARQLWDQLQQAKIGEGLIHQVHRDFCGQGLIRTDAGIILCDIQDGHFPDAAIATWATKEEFIAFFSRQSDFTMSGWDPDEPVFFTEDSWYRNNQRLTTAIIDRFRRGMNI